MYFFCDADFEWAMPCLDNGGLLAYYSPLSKKIAQVLMSSFSRVDAFVQRIPSSSSELTRPLASSSSNHLSPS